MSRQSRLVERALEAQLRPHRSGLLAICGVIVRAAVWGLLIFGLVAIVPQVIPALQELQPKLPPPRGPVMNLINFIRTPGRSIPVVVCLLVLIDLPISYFATSDVQTRRWWSRLMLLIPLGIGLIAAGGFVWLYFQLLMLMIQDAGVGA